MAQDPKCGSIRKGESAFLQGKGMCLWRGGLSADLCAPDFIFVEPLLAALAWASHDL